MISIHLARHPNAALLKALWSLLHGLWGILKASWGVLVAAASEKVEATPQAMCTCSCRYTQCVGSRPAVE